MNVGIVYVEYRHSMILACKHKLRNEIQYYKQLFPHKENTMQLNGFLLFRYFKLFFKLLCTCRSSNNSIGQNVFSTRANWHTL